MQELAKTLLEKTRESSLSVKGIPEIGIEHHQHIFDAVKAGDAEAAASAMRNHISEAMINVQKHEGIGGLLRILSLSDAVSAPQLFSRTSDS